MFGRKVHRSKRVRRLAPNPCRTIDNIQRVPFHFQGSLVWELERLKGYGKTKYNTTPEKAVTANQCSGGESSSKEVGAFGRTMLNTRGISIVSCKCVIDQQF